MGEGNIFGHYGLLRGRRVHYPAIAIEDTLIYHIPADLFDELCEQDAAFADFVELGRPRLESNLERESQQERESNNLMATRVRKLVTRPPLIAEATEIHAPSTAKPMKHSQQNVAYR